MTLFTISSNDAQSSLSGSQFVLLAALCVLVAHVCAWMIYVRIRFGREQFFSRLVDTENYPRGSFWQSFVAALRERRELDADTQVIASPSTNYTLIARLGQGDLCDVYRARSKQRDCLLKIVRTTGFDNLLEKEQFVLRALHSERVDDTYAKYLPVPVESFWQKDRIVSAFDWRDGFFLSEVIRRQYSGGIQPRHIAWMFNRTLEILGFVHQCGWIHGAVLPPHLLFHARNHGLRLVGWTHAMQIGHPLSVAPKRFKSWYPRECQQKRGISPATDIYLAAMSMVWLAGGDPVNRVIPAHMPQEMQDFFAYCIDERPNDAWQLHEQFKNLLEDVYGPPKFVHLTMS